MLFLYSIALFLSNNPFKRTSILFFNSFNFLLIIFLHKKKNHFYQALILLFNSVIIFFYFYYSLLISLYSNTSNLPKVK